MKKKNLSLSQIKVKSFITNMEATQATTAKGGRAAYAHSNGDPLCSIDCINNSFICQSKKGICLTTPKKLCNR